MILKKRYTQMKGNQPSFSVKQCFHIILIFIVAFWVFPVLGNIKFGEVTKQAGISKCSPTAGAAWGDFNGDGWPDLWVTNHYLAPSLYVNRCDGTFSDIAGSVLIGQPIADFHGPAWADFDNDGDQDLLVLTGAGSGRGKCPNYFFINKDDTLRDQAETLGLDYPLGGGRTPLWFDADQDGRLDVLIMNKPRPSRRSPSPLFIQSKNGFKIHSDEFGFRLGKHTKFEKFMALAKNAIRFKFKREPDSIMVNEVFAQLGDLSNDGSVDLIVYSNPMRIFSIDAFSLKEVTKEIGFPDLKSVQDIAIEDFTGDLQLDIYMARSNPWQSSTVQIDSVTIRGVISGSGKPKGLQFRSKGEVKFGLYMPWKDPSDPLKSHKPAVFLGAHRHKVSESMITLSPTDQNIWGPVEEGKVAKQEISIDYDVTTGLWSLISTYPYLELTVKSIKPIEDIKTLGFKSSNGARADKLLVQRNGQFTDGMLSPMAAFLTASRSVVAADFDNDMDIDIYIVCSSASENLPNLLYENDGNGNFSMVPQAGGAEGSNSGRGESAVTADFNRDGFMDVFITNGGGFEPVAAEGPHQIFRNMGNGNHWLELDLEGTTSNRDGIGAQILLEAGGVKQVRTQNGGMHYMSQNYKRVHFGLGANTVVDLLTVKWPSGSVQRLNHIQADQILLIREPN